MTPEEALVLVEGAIAPSTLNKVQRSVFRAAWQGLSYGEMAQELDYDFGYLRDVGSRLWQQLSTVLGQSVTKQNLTGVLRHYQQQGQEVIPVSAPAVALSSSSQDWGEAVDVSHFCGRVAELETLSQWMNQDRCRLVVLGGMGGIGKTMLSVKLAQTLQLDFDFIVWRSLRDLPPLDKLLGSMLRFLLPDTVPVAAALDEKLGQFQDVLRRHRCLIVLDNFDALFAAGQGLGVYQPSYTGFGLWLSQLGQLTHQSCILLTSRETPTEVTALAGTALPVRVLSMTGLSPAAAAAILKAKGLIGQPAELQQLIERYQGHPLALKIVATCIEELFQQRIDQFLRQKISAFNGIRALLRQQLERLSPTERQVMDWLAINREPAALAELKADLFPPLTAADLLEVLESLKGRSLVETTLEGFTLQPVVMEYLTEELLAQAGLELLSVPAVGLCCLRRYALLKATARDYVRETQKRIFLEPLISRAIAELGSRTVLVNQLSALLLQIRAAPQEHWGYTIGNLINLFQLLQVDLTGYDFSHLPVWQADLTELRLAEVNFAYADLRRSVFAETFGGVACVAFSPNGRLLATSDTSGGIQIWELDTGRQLQAMVADQAWTWSVAFSPDSQRLASAGDDDTIKLWDVQTGQCLLQYEGHTNTSNAVAFHPQGNLLASCGQDGTIRFWPTGGVTTDQEWPEQLQGHTGRVWAIAFSPDGQTLVSGSEDLTIKLWDVATGTCLQTWSGHQQWVKTVAISPDGQWLASADFVGQIRLWQLADGTCLKSWQAHAAAITSIAFSSDGQWLVSGSYDQTLKLWSLDSGRCHRTFEEHRNRVWSVACSPDGQLIASGGDDHATRLWSLRTGECVKAWKGHTNSILSLSLSPDQHWVATGHSDQTVKVWDQSGVCQTLRGHTNRVWAVAFAPDPPTEASPVWLASGSADRTINLWNQTGQCLNTLTGHCSWIWAIVFSPDGKTLASGSYDQTIKFWDIASGECLSTLSEPASPAVAVRFSAEGQWLASGYMDGSVILWDLPRQTIRQHFRGHQHSVWDVAFHPTAGLLASASYDHTVKLWDIDSGACLKTLTGHQGPIISVAFCEDANHLISSSFDRTLKLWDLQTETCTRTFYGHSGPVSSLALLADQANWFVPSLLAQPPASQYLVSGSFDETLRLWDLDTGECLTSLRTPRPYDSMNILAITGLTEAQKVTLKALGAVERY